MEAIGRADIAMIPVGAHTRWMPYKVSNSSAAESQSILPMHYQTDVLTFEIAPVEEFSKLFGAEQVKTVDSAELQLDTLPAEQVVYVLQYVK